MRFTTPYGRIAAYLTNGGKLEVAQQMAAHESARTTGLYDRRGDTVSLDEVEKITDTERRSRIVTSNNGVKRMETVANSSESYPTFTSDTLRGPQTDRTYRCPLHCCPESGRTCRRWSV